jgi:hypothetical protein
MSKTTTLKNLFKLSTETDVPAILANKGSCEPSEMVLANIINYSKVLSVRNSNLLGTVEVILN